MARILTPPLLKLLAVPGLLLAFAAYVYITAGLPEPQEADRVAHAARVYSIIKPPGWDARVIYGPVDKRFKDEIEITPHRHAGKETKLFVARYRSQPDLDALQSRERFVPGRFQGGDALIFQGRASRRFLWRAVFQRAEQWYDLQLYLPRPQDVTRSDWWPYLESFRAQEVGTTTGQPSSVPVARQ